MRRVGEITETVGGLNRNAWALSPKYACMGGVQVDERPATVVSQRFGVGFQARCLGFEERARVLEQNVAAVQVALERSLGKQRVEMALENQASSDRAGYRVPV